MIAHTQVQNYLLLVYHISCYTGTVHTKQLRNVENKPKPRRVANVESRAKKSKNPRKTGRVAPKKRKCDGNVKKNEKNVKKT